MQWSTKELEDEKDRIIIGKNNWRKWFAWHPIKLTHDMNGKDIRNEYSWVWLEIIERRLIWNGYESPYTKWYRKPNKELI